MYYCLFLVIRDLINSKIDFYNIYENIDIVTNSVTANSSSFATLGIFGIIFLAAEILWLIWMTKDSQPGDNKWGPNPKELPETKA